MRRVVSLIIAVSALLLVSGCSSDENEGNVSAPSYGLVQDNAETSTDTKVQENTEPETSATQSVSPPSDAEITTANLQYYARELSILYTSWHYPVFYPVNEESLNFLRDYVSKNTEADGSVALNMYDIEVGICGFGVSMDRPLDAWGNKFVVWFDYDTTTEMSKLTIASAGPDGIFTYKGFGKDYTATGFGDDLVVFVDLSQ